MQLKIKNKKCVRFMLILHFIIFTETCRLCDSFSVGCVSVSWCMGKAPYIAVCRSAQSV